MQKAPQHSPEMKTFLRMRVRRELFSIVEGHGDNEHETQDIIQTFDTIREQLAGFPDIMASFAIPCVVVIGDQSAGKSSFVQALTGVPIPRANGRCTTRPLEIRMREPAPQPLAFGKARDRLETKSDDDVTDDDAYATVTVRAVARNSEEEELERRYPTMYDRVDDANAKARLEDVLSTLNNSEQAYSRHSIVLEVAMTRHVALTIVDLPGMSADERANVELHKMYQPFLDNENAIIVAVVAALTRDMGNNNTLTKYMQTGSKRRDQLRDRMIGVITQLDGVAERGVREDFFKLLSPRPNSANPIALPHGYFAVKCPGRDDVQTLKVNGGPRYTAHGQQFDNEVELENYFCDIWIGEYVNDFTHPELDLSQHEVAARFGRSNVRRAIRVELIRRSHQAMQSLPTEVERRLAALNGKLESLPSEDDLNRRQKTIAEQFVRALHDKAHEIRPIRAAKQQGLALVFDDLKEGVPQLMSTWNNELRAALTAIHVFRGEHLVEANGPASAVEELRRRCAEVKEAQRGFVDATEQQLRDCRAVAESYHAASPDELRAAQAFSTQVLVEHLGRRYNDNVTGFLNYAAFLEYVNAVLLVAIEPAVEYVRKYACLCGYILNQMLWDVRHFEGVELCANLKRRFQQRFTETFQRKLKALVEAIEIEFQKAMTPRQEVHITVNPPMLPSAIGELRSQVITEIGSALRNCVGATGSFSLDELIGVQTDAVNTVFARFAQEPPHVSTSTDRAQFNRELVERDVRAYLEILNTHWNARVPMLVENIWESALTHLFSEGQDSFMQHLRTFDLRPGDESCVEDDTAAIRGDIRALRRHHEALSAVLRTLQQYLARARSF